MENILSKPSAGKGSVSVVRFHCIVSNDGESVTSFTTEIDPGLLQILDNFYVVCIAETNKRRKRVTAGFAMKTSLTHNDKLEFPDALLAGVESMPDLKKIWNKNSSFFPFKINIPDQNLLSEELFLYLFAQQAQKINSSN